MASSGPFACLQSSSVKEKKGRWTLIEPQAVDEDCFFYRYENAIQLQEGRDAAETLPAWDARLVEARREDGPGALCRRRLLR
jgi:hypothetical protein